DYHCSAGFGSGYSWQWVF
nr:immunoglobulin light chain junction region [Macaca mulatta]MOV66353.1 immunoglobulin light chain junction region [Macaca mulatta]MOV67181.1 immunoglobulin light chain junction region [Macaca mulatta]MOV67410.1 immunoglobulin light chain junction region [Macaca mulatta]MOV69979.1 immunoglobulin light chain junction region [Macaca mulatta]